MSIEIRAKIICDGCGATIEGKLQTRTSQGQDSYWDAKHKAKKARWVINERYGPAKHYCAKCADGAMVVIEASKTGGIVG